MDLVVGQHHNHKPNRTEEQIEVRNSVKNMLKRAETEKVSAGEIYRDEAKKLVLVKGSEEAAVNLPSYREVQGSIFYWKIINFSFTQTCTGKILFFFLLKFNFFLHIYVPQYEKIRYEIVSAPDQYICRLRTKN